MTDWQGKRRKCAWGKMVRGGEEEILGVSQSVSFAYISLVSWNGILSPRQQVESSRQTPASLLGDGVRGGGLPRITLHDNTMDRSSWCLYPLKVAAEGESYSTTVTTVLPSPLYDTLNHELSLRLIRGRETFGALYCQNQVLIRVVSPNNVCGSKEIFFKEAIGKK